KSADLISVLVSNDKEFTNACQNLEVDIITFDMTKRLEFYLRLPNINSALNRGICFEISLGTALRDMSCRPYLVHIGSQLLRATKGKNIIVSGDPRKPLDTRGPLDIMAMLSIFNMNPQQARNSLTVNPESCVMHGCTFLDNRFPFTHISLTSCDRGQEH
ncbi:RNase P subunit p30-domain-containing protein, partial [Gorgonomyces haynaldii]